MANCIYNMLFTSVSGVLSLTHDKVFSVGCENHTDLEAKLDCVSVVAGSQPLLIDKLVVFVKSNLFHETLYLSKYFSNQLF